MNSNRSLQNVAYVIMIYFLLCSYTEQVLTKSLSECWNVHWIDGRGWIWMQMFNRIQRNKLWRSDKQAFSVFLVSCPCCCCCCCCCCYCCCCYYFRWSTDRSPCQSDTCQNGGTCFETESGFKCLCQVGYSGKTCSGIIQHRQLLISKKDRLESCWNATSQII